MKIQKKEYPYICNFKEFMIPYLGLLYSQNTHIFVSENIMEI